MFLVSSGTCWLNRQLFNYTGGGGDLHCTDSNLLDEIHFHAVPFVSSDSFGGEVISACWS